MRTSPLRSVAAFCMLAIAIGLLVFLTNAQRAGNRDLICYWAAGQQLVHGANPYDTVATLRLERSAGFEGNHPNAMLSLPVAFFLVLPLGFVSAKTGCVLWLLAIVGCLIVSIRVLRTLYGRTDNRVYLFGYCFAPVLACVMAGQLGTFMLLGVVLFLAYHDSRPFLSGAALLLCALKPHLFLPFVVVLVAWAVSRKAYRILAGISAALLASCALSFCVDISAWSQYLDMMRSTAEIQQDFVPTLSLMLRLLVERDAVWLQFVPTVCGSAWALWYFCTRRVLWNWLDHGLLLLLVSVACAPHAWFTDEAVLLPAVLIALYRANDSGRSFLPFVLLTGIALFELLVGVQMTSPYYLWTVPAWLTWYLYATKSKGVPVGEARGTEAEAGRNASTVFATPFRWLLRRKDGDTRRA